MRGLSGIILAVVVASGSALAQQPQEIFSRYVQVFKPEGEFVQRLIKVAPPTGDAWRMVDDRKTGYRLAIPADAEVDTKQADNRVLRVVLSKEADPLKPVLRVHAFTPSEGEPTDVDVDYVAEYAERYSEAAFKGRFNVEQHGLVVLPKKLNLALVGGSYVKGAAPYQRLEWAYLSKEQQLFFTFDCAEKDYERYADRVAQILISLDIPNRNIK